MAGTVVGGFSDETVDEGFAVAGDKLDAGEDALLRVAGGEEVRGDGLGVAVEGGLLFQFEAGGHLAEAVHLIAHFGGGDGGGAAEALVDGGKVVGEGGELAIELVAGGGELAFALNRHGAGAEAEGQVVGGGEGVGQGELMTREDRGDAGLEECSGEAGEDGGDAAEDAPVEDGGLGEVRDLGGTADVGGCREKGVLEDRAKEGVGAETFGGGLEDL